MSQQGAVLQGYNNELVKCIEDLCVKRDELQRHIVEEEDEKRKLQNDIRMLTDRLAKVNESLSKKITARNEFDRLIAETEAAYTKILESSQTLLSVVKKESQSLGCHLPQHKHRAAGGSVSTAAVNRTGPPPSSSTS